PFNGFGKRRPSDRPPVLTPAEKTALKATAEADGARAQANGSGSTDTLTEPPADAQYGNPGIGTAGGWGVPGGASSGGSGVGGTGSGGSGLGSADSSGHDPRSWDGPR